MAKAVKAVAKVVLVRFIVNERSSRRTFMGLFSRGSGNKAKKPPEQVDKKIEPRTLTIVVPFRTGQSCHHISVTAESLFSRSDLAQVIDRPIRSMLEGVAPESWQSLLQQESSALQEQLRARHPAGAVTIQNISVELARS